MSFHLDHCAVCHCSVLTNLMLKCANCGDEVCAECTPSPLEHRKAAQQFGVTGIWDHELDALDPQGDDGGGLVGFLCNPCFTKLTGLTPRPIPRDLLKKITDETLLKLYGKKYEPYVHKPAPAEPPDPDAVRVEEIEGLL